MTGTEAAKGGLHLYVKLKIENTQVFIPESEGVPEHHSHPEPVSHKVHFLPTLFLIPRNLQNKSLCLKIPFNRIFHLPQAVLQQSTAPTLTWSLLAAL